MQKKKETEFTLLKYLLHKNLVKVQQGFTLIELLVVVAIIGLLAVVVLNFINPVEMTARARDSGRIGGVTQLAKAVLDYNLNKNEYPIGTSWDTDLEDINEVNKFPAGIKYAYSTVSPCSTNARPSVNPTFCYSLDSENGIIIFSKLESKKQTVRCTLPEEIYVVYSTSDNVTGLVCSDGDLSPWEKGDVTYVE